MEHMSPLEREIASIDGAYLACENRGIYITSLGHAYTASKERIELKTSNVGYLYVDGSYFKLRDPKAMPHVRDATGARVPGDYIQNMVVYKMGDATGAEFTYERPLDHLNMDHTDNRPENLQFVPTLVNLYRAMVATDFSEKFAKLFSDEYLRILNSVETEEAKEAVKRTLDTYIRTAERDYANYIVPKDKKEG